MLEAFREDKLPMSFFRALSDMDESRDKTVILESVNRIVKKVTTVKVETQRLRVYFSQFKKGQSSSKELKKRELSAKGDFDIRTERIIPGRRKAWSAFLRKRGVGRGSKTEEMLLDALEWFSTQEANSSSRDSLIPSAF